MCKVAVGVHYSTHRWLPEEFLHRAAALKIVDVVLGILLGYTHFCTTEELCRIWHRHFVRRCCTARLTHRGRGYLSQLQDTLAIATNLHETGYMSSSPHAAQVLRKQ